MTKVAFLFPGQGAQAIGMGRAAYDAHASVRSLYDRAADVLGFDLARICWDGPAEKLDSTVISQPALYVASLAAVEVLKEQNPDVIASCQGAAGLSLGEYTALAFAGALDFETGLRLVQRRGEAMQAASDAAPSGMVSVLGLERPKVEALCESARQPGEVLQIANLLCPGNIVVSGSKTACARVVELAPSAGAMKAIPLAVAGAFHTPLMQPAVDRLVEGLAQATVQRPRVPVMSNVDAQWKEDPDAIRQALIQQVVAPVLWEDSMQRMLAAGFDSFWEIGPGRVLRGLLKRIDRKAACESVTV